MAGAYTPQYELLLPNHPNVLSLPLLLPDNCEFNEKTFKVTKDNNKDRSSLNLVQYTAGVLEKIKSNVGVVSVVGPARTGKSYLISRMLGSKNAFSLGHTFDACTFGVWISTKAIKKDDYLVLLIDTEGIGHVDADIATDAPLFIYSILVSSLLIYNSTGVPKSKDLGDMEFFSKITASIRISPDNKETVVNEEKQESSHLLRKITPHLHWALRDVALEPTVKNQKVSFETYLHDLLVTGSNHVNKIGVIKQSILNNFQQITGNAFPIPSDNPDIVQNMDSIEDTELNPRFTTALKEWLVRIYGIIQAKNVIHGDRLISMTGDSFVKLTKLYLKPLNNPNAIWNIGSAWEEVVKSVTLETEQMLLEQYKTNMIKYSEQFPVDEKDLTTFHRKLEDSLHKEMVRLLNSCGVKDDVYKAFCSKLATWKKVPIKDKFGKQQEGEEISGGLLHPYTLQNIQKSDQLCTSVSKKAYDKFVAKIEKEKYNWNDIESDMLKVVQEYEAEARGPAFDRVWTSLLEKCQQNMYLLKKMSEERRAKFQAQVDAQRKETELKTQIEDFENKMNNLRNNMEAEQKKLETQLKEQKKHAKKEQDELQKKHLVDIEKLKSGVVSQNDAFRKEMEEFHKKNAETMQKLFTQMQQQQAESNKLMTDLIQKIANMPPPVVHVHGGCFHPSTLVTLSTRTEIPISKVKVGDKIQTYSKKKKQTKFTEVIYVNVHHGEFLVMVFTVKTPQGLQYTVTITPDHVVPVMIGDKKKRLVAGKCTVGDKLLVLNNTKDQMDQAEITAIRQYTYSGKVYNPVTFGNHLLVNGILATCYNINYNMEKYDTIPLKIVYKTVPKSVQSGKLNKIVDKWDSVTEPFFYKISS